MADTPIQTTGEACHSMILEARDIRVYRTPDTSLPPLIATDSLKLFPSQICDLTGPSGSGKTTLLLALARLHPYASGTLILNGADAAGIASEDWRTRVALLPQKAAFSDGSVRENLLLAFSFKSKRAVEKPADEAMRRLLDEVGLDDIELDHDIERLSVGQAARVALVRTLLTRPDVLLLDEVDAALDADSVLQISKLISAYVKRECRSCMRIRHSENDGYADRHLVLSDGSLLEETV